MQLVDIGANLTHESFRADFDLVLTRARAHGVAQMVVTGASAAGSRMALSLAEDHPGVLFATAGVHPHHAIDYDDATDALLRELTQSDHVKAVGETGSTTTATTHRTLPRSKRSIVNSRSPPNSASPCSCISAMHMPTSWPR